LTKRGVRGFEQRCAASGLAEVLKSAQNDATRKNEKPQREPKRGVSIAPRTEDVVDVGASASMRQEAEGRRNTHSSSFKKRGTQAGEGALN